jgi:predicted RNA-binding Zn ribbon-like protein
MTPSKYCLMVTMHHGAIRGQVATQRSRTARSRGPGRDSAGGAGRASVGRHPRKPGVTHLQRRDAPWTFHLGYGALCLDFANTVSWRGSGNPVDRLPVYEELIRFGEQSKLLSAEDARLIRREAARQPEAAARALKKAVALREALYRIFSALAGGRSASATDLETLNGSLPDALIRLRLAAGAEGVSWAWRGEREALDRLLWPVARDAAVFLTSTDVTRLRSCANPHCRWVFYDGTRSGTRRWCTMAVCGNRAKLRRYRQRLRRG